MGPRHTLTPSHLIAHYLSRAPVVRHYKVKHEGSKYVIDVEDPVSIGLGSRLARCWSAPFSPSPNRNLHLPPQFSCASLDAVVNYFVSHTKRALVPFLLDEDYEKVLGGCGFRELGGPGPHLSCPHATGTPLADLLAAAPPPGCPLCSRLRGSGQRERREFVGGALRPGSR